MWRARGSPRDPNLEYAAIAGSVAILALSVGRATAYDRTPMAAESSPARSPVVVDGVVSGEKLSQLLTLEAEYPELDFKRGIDLTTKKDEIELAKDVGAMRVRGGYLVLGATDAGDLADGMDNTDLRQFDEANLAPKLLRYLADLGLRVQIFERAGHPVVLMCVLPSPTGCTFFIADGGYRDGGKVKTAFRKGEVFWRDGTRSVRISPEGFEEVIARRVASAKDQWLEDQHNIRRRERELDEIGAAQTIGDSAVGGVRPESPGGRRPLDHLNLDLAPDELTKLALELARDNDDVGFKYLLNEAVARARALIEAGDLDSGLVDLLDRLTCLAASLLQHDQEAWFERVIEALVEIYALPFSEGDVRRFGYSTRINSAEVGPRVWLAVIEHVFALGALAVRLEKWGAVRTLTLQLPRPLEEEGYDKNWLRHALTMAARANHLTKEGDDGGAVDLSLLSLAREVVGRLDCVRPTGLNSDDDGVFTDLTQFDLLSNVIAIDDVEEATGRTFYPNFARFRQERVQPIADRLVADQNLRTQLLRHGDDVLAGALSEIGRRAADEGWRFDGFLGWAQTPVADYIAEHLPPGS